MSLSVCLMQRVMSQELKDCFRNNGGSPNFLITFTSQQEFLLSQCNLDTTAGSQSCRIQNARGDFLIHGGVSCTADRIRLPIYFSFNICFNLFIELLCLFYCRQLRRAVGLDNLLYTPDADFSCFADLALTSPEDYYIEGQGSLLQ